MHPQCFPFLFPEQEILVHKDEHYTWYCTKNTHLDDVVWAGFGCISLVWVRGKLFHWFDKQNAISEKVQYHNEN